MSATWSMSKSIQPALFAGNNRTQRMPMRSMCFATATASILLIGTGVLAPVSLFVLMLVLLVSLLLVVVLLSLILSGLTGLELNSLVGLTEGLVPGTT